MYNYLAGGDHGQVPCYGKIMKGAKAVYFEFQPG
jgi:hypothetical protein